MSDTPTCIFASFPCAKDGQHFWQVPPQWTETAFYLVSRQMDSNKTSKRSESHRVRQVHRYLSAWREVQTLLYGASSLAYLGQPEDTEHRSLPKSSPDKALTAFAQLSTLRLNVTRAVISLIDANTQYILAEATQTISLMKDSRHRRGDQLTFGRSNIPRNNSICCGVFESSSTVSDPTGQELSINAFVVHNPLEDKRYKDSMMVRRLKIKFLASVPIVTMDGVMIGAYSIMSNDSRGDLTFFEYQFLQDVSSTVFEHLVLVRDRLNSVRGAKMVNSLTNFIVQSDMPDKNTISAGPINGRDYGNIGSRHSSDSEGYPLSSTSGAAPRKLRSQFEPIFSHRSGENQAKDDTIVDGNDPTLKVSVVPSTPSTIESDLKVLFGRATSSLLECTGANGCIFLEASFGGSRRDPSLPHGKSQRFYHMNRQNSAMPSHYKEERYDTGTDYLHETQSESDEGFSSDPNEGSKKASNVLGSSIYLKGKGQGESGFPTIVCTEQELRRCINRYPRGKIFNFTDQGTISSGDDTLSDNCHKTLPGILNPSAPPFEASSFRKRRNPARVRKFVADELVKILPGVRSVIFYPLWDFTQSRWYAGLFLWTTKLGRFMDTSDEFPYIRAFSNTIMNEVSRLTALHSERAKTTFIANISHELRSPLHGILGSVEFMSDTRLDSFQHSLVDSVETCGKTLLDTIDHVLDYAKINYFGSLESRIGRARKISQPSRSGIMSHTNRTTTFNICTLVEEVVEAVYAGQTFKQSKAGIPANTFDDHKIVRTSLENLGSVFPVPIRQLERLQRFSNGMTVVLDVDANTDCVIISQPGALRRVVMNLFGNALKYSYIEKGLVKVSLRRLTQAMELDNGQVNIELLVSDIGRGMSAEYLRHQLYRPFSQEDPFSVGTGLGLSIVRQIVTSLGGKIRINSEQGRGTDVSVNLHLPTIALPIENKDKHFSESVAKLTAGLKVCILQPGDVKPSVEQSRNSMVDALRKLLTTWFGMIVFSATNKTEYDADFYVYPEPPSMEALLEVDRSKEKASEHRQRYAPVIIVCTNAFEEAALKSSGIESLTSIGWVIEIISQPCGPSKMARAFESCFRNAQVAFRPLNSNTGTSSNAFHPDQMQPDTDVSKPATPTRDLIQTSAANEKVYTAKENDGNNLPNSTSIMGADDLTSRQNTKTSNWPKIITNKLCPSIPDKTGPHILLVDDNAVNLKLLVAFMNKLALPYACAADGLEAFNTYQREFNAGTPFDYILMDINMPVMDGLASTKEIRRFERQQGGKKAIIAALTGMAGQSIQEDAFQIGFDHYFSKPVRFKELKRLILCDSDYPAPAMYIH